MKSTNRVEVLQIASEIVREFNLNSPVAHLTDKTSVSISNDGCRVFGNIDLIDALNIEHVTHVGEINGAVTVVARVRGRSVCTVIQQSNCNIQLVYDIDPDFVRQMYRKGKLMHVTEMFHYHLQEAVSI